MKWDDTVHLFSPKCFYCSKYSNIIIHIAIVSHYSRDMPFQVLVLQFITWLFKKFKFNEIHQTATTPQHVNHIHM